MEKIKDLIKNSPTFTVLYRILTNYYPGRTIKQKISLFSRLHYATSKGFPVDVAFEPASKCSLDCEFCMVKRLEQFKARRHSFLEFKEFKKIIDDMSPFVTNIQFSGGEPILNKEIFEMLAYARKKNIWTLLPTNIQLLGYRDNLENLLDSPPDELLIAYEATDKDTYEKIRKKGDYDKLYNNVVSIVEEKKRRGQYYPIITLQMVITRKNQHLKDELYRVGKEIGVDRVGAKALGVWPEGDKKYDKHMVDEYVVTMDENDQSRHSIDSDDNLVFHREVGQCPAIRHVYIGSGGEIIPCWYIIKDTEVMGNAVDSNFIDVWNSRHYIEYRDKMKNDWANPLCHRCIGIGPRPERNTIADS